LRDGPREEEHPDPGIRAILLIKRVEGNGDIYSKKGKI